MNTLFTADALMSLVVLCVLEIVLGIDNVIFVSIVMNKLPEPQRLTARRFWMIAGILMRVILLVCLGWLVKNPLVLYTVDAEHRFELKHLIFFAGGLFLLYKTVSEIHHKLEGDEAAEEQNESRKVGSSLIQALLQILIIDMVFSFDSMLTAVMLGRQIPVMVTAVIIAMFIMFVYSGKIAVFIQKHPTLKMLALSFLVMVGFSMFFESMEPLHHQTIPKGYIYFAMAFSFSVELLNMKLRKQSNPVKLHEPKVEDVTGEKNNAHPE
ncbi:TerC family protein [Chitinophagaceae bacterium MMS25-I14]